MHSGILLHLAFQQRPKAICVLMLAGGKTGGSRVPRMTWVQSKDHGAFCLLCTCLHRVFFLCANHLAVQTAHAQRVRPGLLQENHNHKWDWAPLLLGPLPSSTALLGSSTTVWPPPGPLSLLAAPLGLAGVLWQQAQLLSSCRGKIISRRRRAMPLACQASILGGFFRNKEYVSYVWQV